MSTNLIDDILDVFGLELWYEYWAAFSHCVVCVLQPAKLFLIFGKNKWGGGIFTA